MTEQLTREKVLSMPAGRDLDALVAERVMGWDIHSKSTGKFNPGHDLECNYMTHDSLVVRRVPEFSADISTAFEVVEEMQNNEWDFTLKNHKRLVHKRKYEAIFGAHYSAFASTAPEAICKAALLAVMDRD